MPKKKSGVRSQKTKKAKTRIFEFEVPKIIGILSEKSVPKTTEKTVARQITKLGRPYVCLPFKVEKKYLKNVVACMRLMDIGGLLVLGSHCRNIVRHVPALDRTSKKSRKINVIKRRNLQFKGYHFDEKGYFYRDVVNFLTTPE